MITASPDGESIGENPVSSTAGHRGHRASPEAPVVRAALPRQQ